MPSKRSNRTLWIVLGSVGGILLLICIGCGILLFALGQRVANNPLIASTYTVGLFCGYEQQQDYRAAYALFSPSLQAKTTAGKFVQDSQARDAASGVVQSCQTATSGGSVPQSGDTTASFELEVARKGGTTVTGTITLVKVDSGWKIDSVDPSLSLV